MSERELHFVVPGPLDQRTGGYLYGARMVERLKTLGWRIRVHNLGGTFPDPDPTARRSLATTLDSIPRQADVLIDGLAMGAIPEPIEAHTERLRILSLVHHPLADETGLDERTRTRFAELESRALAACAGTIVTSRFTADRLAAVFGISPNRIRIAVPGTDPAPLARGPGPGEPPRVLSVGSVTPRKGHDVLVRALDAIRDLPWSCICGGSLERAPGYSRSVRAEVRRAGLSGRIRFLGELGETALEDEYAAASLFVLPSHYEGYGMVLTEALARGLPIVSTTGGAIPYTVPQDAGVLVAPGDPPALASALAELLSNEEAASPAHDSRGAERRARLEASARRHARKLPDWSEAARGLAHAISELTRLPDTSRRNRS